MKHDLLPANGKFYKANLHCHTSLSDGCLSQEEIREVYRAAGYSIVAFTDHELLFPANHLTDDTFLALNGVELGVNEKERLDPTGKKVHLCCIARDPENHHTPCYHSTKYCAGKLEENRKLAFPVPGLPDFEREYSHDGVNRMIAEAKRLGFFVTYNHPKWSLEREADYGGYCGLDAMEICNFGGITNGYTEYDPEVYDAFLRQGKRIFCVAGDDNHNYGKPGTRSWDSFGAFVMVKAERLEYGAVIRALEQGAFYASQGPEIHALYFEDGAIHIRCTPAEKIILTTARRRGKLLWAEEGESLEGGVLQVYPEDGYVRLTVVDHCGRAANTNAFFTDTLPFSAR